MATSAVEINKKRCIKCDGAKSSGSLFTCDGCQQRFCARHVGEHRQELSIQLENAMQEHDLIQQESHRSTIEKDILNKIDVWEKESIIIIQKIAETTRTDFYQWYKNTNDRIKTECTELAKNLRVARETDDFSESDLSRWSQILIELRTQLQSMTKINITEDKQQPYIRLIKVQHDNHSSTNTSSQKDWSSMTNSRSRTNRYEDQDLDTSSRSTTMKRTESNDNPIKPETAQCKQQ
jgi:hypothetical protein